MKSHLSHYLSFFKKILFGILIVINKTQFLFSNKRIIILNKKTGKYPCYLIVGTLSSTIFLCQQPHAGVVLVLAFSGYWPCEDHLIALFKKGKQK